MKPLLVLRVGYMERYEGPATITGGGAYIAANGVGGEVFNFKPSRGKCYGYAMSLHFAGLNLRFLDNTRQWREGDELADVDIVFIARKPGVGQVVVGWYRDSTVFHKQYRVRRGAIPGMKETMRHFLCVADADSVQLLPEDERTFVVPYAPAGHKGFPGQSNVWYPEHHAKQPGVTNFIKRLQKYISNTSGVPLVPDEIDEPARSGKGGRGRKPDHAHNAAVESAAVDVVWNYYEAAGYRLKSVESENAGWDLEARKGFQTLRIEVKGTSGLSIYFELTPNEYSKLKQHADQYRVCVVCEALLTPRVHELLPEQIDKGWHLVSKEQGVHVPLMERIAAIGAEIAREGQTN
ncbi:MAG: hypothetical protein FD134_386 [Gallionellaceae bacterium]|nr:MAG: hypothetical protein FD134_386 [Gallionellaceae bacterium]